jgi:hypothetical protein
MNAKTPRHVGQFDHLPARSVFNLERCRLMFLFLALFCLKKQSKRRIWHLSLE